MSLLRQLWPIIASLHTASERTQAFAHAWRAVLDADIEAQTTSLAASAALDGTAAASSTEAIPPPAAPARFHTLLEQVLRDPVLREFMTGRSMMAQQSQGAAPAALPKRMGVSGASAAVSDPFATDGTLGTKAPSKTSDSKGKGFFGSKKDKNPAPAKDKISAPAQALAAEEAQQQQQPAAGDTKNANASLAATAVAKIGSSLKFTGPELQPVGSYTLAPTLRQEAVCSLLLVCSQHPAAAASASLCQRLAAPSPSPSPAAASSASPAGAAEPRASGSAAGSAADLAAKGSGVSQLQLCEAVAWVKACTAALVVSRSCLGWEPYINPNPTAQELGASPVNLVLLTSIPADTWLKAMQLCCSATHGLQAYLHTDPLPPAAEAAEADTQGNGTNPFLPEGTTATASSSRRGSHAESTAGGQGPSATAAAAPGTSQAAATAAAGPSALLRVVVEAYGRLQNILRQGFFNWRKASRALKARLLWVACQHLELTPRYDDTWQEIVACLDEVLLRAPRQDHESHMKDMAISSAYGHLFVSQQVGGNGSGKRGWKVLFLGRGRIDGRYEWGADVQVRCCFVL